ncbi:alkaline phosphatase D family protein [Paraferrimonas haliotis]|uniref:PhoD-like phosphatase metallophosphatase domain-containing protein n=1 Tax=Paraferrimonas haliotis TaxID=2013866 RepID=A0AA37WXT8_9GAMM|nr:alkaline phosphatase D family protein [Paraferrimonas haliotis]GLS83000.1 hypothetical protein GCM10007894_09770 [Paraferrimonas haliotis]
MDEEQYKSLPLVLAGPILRRMTSKRLTFWMALSQRPKVALSLLPSGSTEVDLGDIEQHCCWLTGSDNLHYLLVDLPLKQELPLNTWIGYQFHLTPKGSSQALDYRQWAPYICYPNRDSPGFIIKPKVDNILHGSCRKPHHESADGLVRADNWLAQLPEQEWPSLLLLSGDQIYADDVATPMLVAIHQAIAQLELPEEPFCESVVALSSRLHTSEPYYQNRQSLLPQLSSASGPLKTLFKGVRKPIFTSSSAHNHLVSLAEVLVMYLLVWSPALWSNIKPVELAGLSPKQLLEYQQQQQMLDQFRRGLDKVQRLLANVPTAMIFDDHDVTDDWNLSAAWEQASYSHPFSKRIIGNALVAYAINQGWGNAPEVFKEVLSPLQSALLTPGSDAHQQLIERLFRFRHWHFQWDLEPALVVLDTRTNRWRSERKLAAPSGLMDWESLTELQLTLMGKESVIMVSPAPVFGVKLIEIIQSLFTKLGQPLVIDAENWMAHSGSANTMLNMFSHPKTPQHFTILSGDVHYSFVFKVTLRGQSGGPDIWQITSSGIKNTFPKTLLDILDRLNRWLYAPQSPLNWFNKRRRMKVTPHKPADAAKGERLLNASGIGLVSFDEQGRPSKITQLCSNGQEVQFQALDEQSHWD